MTVKCGKWELNPPAVFFMGNSNKNIHLPERTGGIVADRAEHRE